ncbi:MAG: MOSC domain-containing protein [Candidatus Aminicenantes bacterium]|nr:MOSC domain-containing protein [Candidatus Aminicenantes bacterium]NLH76727.1 MOSC domain-containing protein [Acidobacteriota bacterium]
MTASAGKAGVLVSVNVSLKKGQVKTPVPRAALAAGRGLEGDAHRDFGHRQVSLLMAEDIDAQREKCGGGTAADVIKPGAYAENLTTRGIDLGALAIGDELAVGGAVRLRVTQIGKECHAHCAVQRLTGECIMPVRGIFCEVVEGGEVRPGDGIEKR